MLANLSPPTPRQDLHQKLDANKKATHETPKGVFQKVRLVRFPESDWTPAISSRLR